MNYATPTNELFHTNQWTTSHQPMSYTTPTNELRHNIYICTYIVYFIQKRPESLYTSIWTVNKVFISPWLSYLNIITFSSMAFFAQFVHIYAILNLIKWIFIRMILHNFLISPLGTGSKPGTQILMFLVKLIISFWLCRETRCFI